MHPLSPSRPSSPAHMARYALAVGVAGSIALLAAPLQAANLKSAAWWDETESGWGLFVADQGNVLSPFWFTYDSDGEPVWFLAATTAQADGSYSGDVLRFNGVPLAQIAGQAADPAQVIGRASLRFAGDSGLQFDYTVNGQSQSKTLTRFPFGDKDIVCASSPASRASASNYSDIWWKSTESGWGLHVNHVDNQLFVTWYTYDTDREAVFFQGASSKQADGSFSGTLFRAANGTPFTSINGQPATSGLTEVGTFTLRFSDGERGTFQYSMGGVTQSKEIQRFQFGSTAQVCTVQAFNAGNDPGNGTSGDDCAPPYTVGDRRQERIVDSGANGATSTTERLLEITGTTSFQGQNALVEAVSGQTSAGSGVYAKNYVNNGTGSRISYGAQALNPSSAALISTSVNEPLAIEQPRAFAVGQSWERRWKVNSNGTDATTGASFSTTSDLRNKFTLVSRESVTVPAGTFTACKFAVEIDLDNSASVQGFSITTQVRRTGTTWSSPQFGLLKSEDSGNSTVSTPAGSQVTPVSTRIELLSATIAGVSTR